jgi:hypothetical protein
MRLNRLPLLAVSGLLLTASPAAAATPRTFHNCAALNRVYPHGVAKSAAVLRHANGFTARPFVSASVYAANSKARDGDHDGVMCER